MEIKTVAIVDLRHLIHRHWHGITSGGLDPLIGYPRSEIASSVVGAVRRLKSTVGADEIVAADDSDGPTWRHEIFTEYKANRQDTPEGFDRAVEAVRVALKEDGFPVVWTPGYEADDIVATLSRRCVALGVRAVVITSDKDLFQLVNDRDGVSVWDVIRDQLLDEATVERRMGVEPRLICDLLALMGDKSDNFPGVPGIGPKKATKLLRAHGSLWGVLSAASSSIGDGPKVYRLIEEHSNSARMAWSLARLRTAPIDIPDCLVADDMDYVRLDDNPLCCGFQMVFLCDCVGFRSYWCSACSIIIDRFDCCGASVRVKSEYVSEAAPLNCPRCGRSRLSGADQRPNGPGEGAMRAGALGMVR